ncbi:MAG: DUF402 domain-containing protein [Chloroflexi bacterium]|nr:DUF402 domain-containing protein [Chloroflexota bacterium]
MRITEVKRHLDGRTDRFDCRLLLRRPQLAVVRFDHEQQRRAGGYRIPAGSQTHGFFWPRRSYVLYRIVGPDGRLIAHRFDVVEDVRLGEGEVSYTDLLLDLWVDPDGQPRLEDEDEVEEFARGGLLVPGQRKRIDTTRDLLLRRHRVIVREAVRLLDEAGR